MAVDFDGDRMIKKQEEQPEHPKRPLCACSSYSCNKLFLFLYTCLFVAVGAALFLFGVYVEFYSLDYHEVNSSFFIPAILLMSAGFVIVISSLLGIAGVLRENLCLLKTFLVFTVLAFLAQVAIGVLAFIYRQEVPGITSDSLMFLVKGYQDNNLYRKAMDNVQSGFQCCGLNSYLDYDMNPYFDCGSKTPQRCGVPWTCCRGQKGQMMKINCGYEVRWNDSAPVDVIYTMGCTDTFQTWLSWHLDLVGIVGLGTAIPQIIGILLAYFFVRQVKEMKVWYRVGM